MKTDNNLLIETGELCTYNENYVLNDMWKPMWRPMIDYNSIGILISQLSEAKIEQVDTEAPYDFSSFEAIGDVAMNAIIKGLDKKIFNEITKEKSNQSEGKNDMHSKILNELQNLSADVLSVAYATAESKFNSGKIAKAKAAILSAMEYMDNLKNQLEDIEENHLREFSKLKKEYEENSQQLLSKQTVEKEPIINEINAIEKQLKAIKIKADVIGRVCECDSCECASEEY